MEKYKRILLLLIPVVIIILLVIFITKPKDYTKTYNIDGIAINESYSKKYETYIFSSTYSDKLYDIIMPHKYVQKKKLIKSVKIKEDDNSTCIYYISDYFDTYPICYLDDERVDYRLLNENSTYFKYDNYDTVNSKYKNIKINALLNKNYAIWNHYGYDYINSTKNEELKLFKKESYYDEHSFQVGKYILIPNLDDSYYFKSFKQIDMTTGKVTTWNFKNEISYDFYLLGTYDGKSYIVDRKNKIEYEINPKKKTIEIVSNGIDGKIYDNGWTQISLTKLVNSDYTFNQSLNIDYVINNKSLYMRYVNSDTKILISNQKIDRIIYANEQEVYYIVGNTLYYYSPLYKEISLLEYSEWEFNEKNSVYIY